MPCRPPGADPKPRGRPRKAFADLKPSGKRSRRKRDGEKQPVTAIIVMPQTPTKEPKKMGRPLMPFTKLSKKGRLMRCYRARLAEQHVPLALTSLVDAVEEARAVEEATLQLEPEEEARAERHGWSARQQQLLVNRNEAADGPKSLTMLRAAARVEGEWECGLLCGEADREVRPMRCCGKLVCAPCLSTWLQRHGKQDVPKHYSDGPDGMSGTALYNEDPLDAHRCPFCRRVCLSVTRGLGSSVE